ncbi:MAG: adenylate/guanylate cyclase domain-containing protein [bacterium]
MEKDPLSRKLAVILHADVVGSTALVQQNETLAHERIQDAFNRFSETINSYGGTTREVRGDALVAEFERASDAVAAALAFQADHTYLNSRLKDDLRPTIRVGIAMGEVVIADDTVTGSGVVLAQRVEQLADPGGLCITAALHEALPKRMPFDLENLGEQVLKGFDDPVRVYGVELSAGQSVPAPEQNNQPDASPKKPNWIATTVVVALVIVGGTYYWFKAQVPQEEPASIERMAYPLPDKPSIAVLPFTNISDDPKQEYFADGMTEDLITDLSKISGLFVIARNSSFSYKGQQVKVRQVAEELGVRYVMEGSVRRSGNQVRINAQLIDATTGGHLWAERYDGSPADIFALQDQVTTKIVNAMSVTLTAQEIEDLEATGASNAAAHDAYLQGLSFYLRSTPKDNAKAEPYFKRAIELDPEFKRAYAALAKVYFKSGEPEYSYALGITWRKAMFLAYKNLVNTEGANIADVHVIRSWMALLKHQVDIALLEAENALNLNANDVEAFKAKSRALIYSGHYEEGRQLASMVIRLDPATIAEPLHLISLSHFASGNYEASADYAARSVENDPTTGYFALLLAAAYGKLGMEDKANDAWLKYRKLSPGPRWIAAVVLYYPFEDGEILNNLADGFSAAGAVERPPSRYIKLDRENRLSGHEIKTLLFGHTIKGRSYWTGNAWQQKRTIEGNVLHSGISVHTGLRDIEEERKGLIEDDRLCDRWSHEDGDVTNCVLIFRDSDRGPNNYYMLIDEGPHPFQVLN